MNMLEIPDWISLAILAGTLAQFVFSLRNFFTGKLIVYLVTLTVVASAIPNVLEGSNSSLAVAACYITVSVVVSTLLWDSRHFIIDTFSFNDLFVSRPVFIVYSVMVILVIFDVLPFRAELCLWLVGVQILIAAILSEAAYSIAKRNNWLVRQRRSSLPRMETISGNTPTHQNLV